MYLNILRSIIHIIYIAKALDIFGTIFKTHYVFKIGVHNTHILIFLHFQLGFKLYQYNNNNRVAL